MITFTGDGYVEVDVRRGRRPGRPAGGALTRWACSQGDRVGTFMWNNQTHLEAYLAIPCMGAVLHTLNIRLFPEQLAYVINHAEDKVIIVDASIAPLLAKVRDQLTTVEHIIVKGTGDTSGLGDDCSTTTRLLDAAPAAFEYPEVDERVGHGDVLHERHDRQPQGRHVQPPQHVHALDDGHVDRQHRAQRAATGCWSSCRCSTPTRGACRTRRG